MNGGLPSLSRLVKFQLEIRVVDHLKIWSGLAVLLALAGCVSKQDYVRLKESGVRPEVEVTPASLPTAIQPYPRINDVLLCIQKTGVLEGKTFIVGPFADSTGKINAVAAGATGAFVPQGGSAAYITDSLQKAGARVISTYFGAPAINAPAQYMINGIFNSLDFGAPISVDVRVAGVGPTVARGWAQVTLAIQLDEAGTRLNRQMSMIQRPVRYSQFGVGVGRVVGDTLVTGGFSTQNQERLQFEALNGPIALGVADVLLKEFPVARSRCASEVADLLQPAAGGAYGDFRAGYAEGGAGRE